MVLTEESNGTNGKYLYEDRYTVKVGKYSFSIRPEEKQGFKKRLEEDPFLQERVFKNRVEDELWASFEYSVRKQSNAIIKCFGIPESGKSTILQILAYHLSSEIKKHGKTPQIKISFSYPETIHTLKSWIKKPNGILVLIQDEQNEMQGSESRAYQKQIDNLLKTFRAAQIFVLLASPDDIPLSVCNTKIEAIAKDETLRTNWGLLYVPKRTKSNKIVFEPLGTLLLEYLPEIESFFDKLGYGTVKTKYIEKIIENRGLQTIEIPEDVLEEGINKILTEAKKYSLKTKEQVKALANVLGIGTINTTKTIAELAALRWEAIMEAEKEKIEEQRKLEEFQKQKKERERISKLVKKVAREIYDRYDLSDKKAFSRIVKGYIIDNYESDWQELIKHANYMWSLAEYWQDSENSKKAAKQESSTTFAIETANRTILRKAFEESILKRYKNAKLAQRGAYYFIFDEGETHSSWTIQKSRKSLEKHLKQSIKYPGYSKFFRDRKQDIMEIECNNKIWGDAGEIYFKYMIEHTVKKGKTEGWIKRGVAIEPLCAADLRSSGGSTSMYDVEVLVNGSSVAAVNVKFTFLDNQSFRIIPECEHAHPYLFVIDKATLNEHLVPLETGKEYVSGIGGVQSQSLEDFVKDCIRRAIE